MPGHLKTFSAIRLQLREIELLAVILRDSTLSSAAARQANEIVILAKSALERLLEENESLPNMQTPETPAEPVEGVSHTIVDEGLPELRLPDTRGEGL